MGFQNDITGQNGNLIREQIQSPGFQSGVTGWIIRKDGTVEFNSGVFRGSIAIGNSQELLIYSSAVPAAGTLLISIAGVAGVDGFGNSFPQGVAISMGGFQMVLGETGGSPLIYFGTGRAAVLNSSAIQTIVQGVGTGQYDQVQFLGAQDSTQLDAVDTALTGSSPDGTQRARILDFYHDPTGGFHFYRTMDFSGFSISAGGITAVQPLTGVSRAVPAVGETWHTLGLTADFTTNVQDQAPRVRLEATGGGDVICLDGVVYTSIAAVPANTVIATLGAGYRPTIRKRFPIITNFSGATSMTLIVATTGAITAATAGTAISQQAVFDGIRFPVT